MPDSALEDPDSAFAEVSRKIAQVRAAKAAAESAEIAKRPSPDIGTMSAAGFPPARTI